MELNKLQFYLNVDVVSVFNVLESSPTEQCLLSNRIEDYFYVSQGKTRIPGVNDCEEMVYTDVSGQSLSRNILPELGFGLYVFIFLIIRICMYALLFQNVATNDVFNSNWYY